MRQVLKSLTAVAFSVAALLGAKSASATQAGVIFIHGTGDYAGTMTCSGSGASTVCTVPAAASGYWTSGELTSVAKGLPYAVVGYRGATCSPWASGGEYGITDPNGTTGSCGNASGQGNADVIAGQIQQFLTASGATEIALVTHSGGSNQARYILQNYTKSTAFTAVKNATKRVVTIAGCTDGTYLANEAINGTIGSFIANLAGYGGEGVAFLQTSHMNTYNGASSFFGGINNPIQGVTAYSTGGTSGSTCYGVKIFGACIGITGPTLGGVIGACDSSVDDAALLLLHTLYLNVNDSTTYRNSCSDGFISCQGSQALGHTFGYSEKQDHNQSRRQCNNLDVEVRNEVVGSASGFVEAQWPSQDVDPVQVDACGFSQYAPVVSSSGHSRGSGTTVGWTEGCQPSNLGNGQCDWDCVALYGHDAAPTWAGTAGHSAVTAWGATDDCSNSSNPANTSNTYNSVTYIDSSNNAWGDRGTYTNSSGTYYTQFNGKTCNSTSSCDYTCGSGGTGSSCEWFTDPQYSSTYAVGYCPTSWIGDGFCDECVLALYGSDGNDCNPSTVTSCGGVISQDQPYSGSTIYYYDNPLYNETNPSNTSQWLFWTPISAVAGDGICEATECPLATSNTPAFAGTSWCNVAADCPSGSSCVDGACTTSSADCTLSYKVPAVTCTENNNCNGDYCVSGTCSVTSGTCTTDANCPGPSPATSVCSSGVCTCTTNSDCSNGASCVSGSCNTTITQSLCR
jgi:hypothetical protein